MSETLNQKLFPIEFLSLKQSIKTGVKRTMKVTLKNMSEIQYFLCPQCQAKPAQDEKYCVECGLEFGMCQLSEYKKDSHGFLWFRELSLEAPHYKPPPPPLPVRSLFAFAFFIALVIIQVLLQLLS